MFRETPLAGHLGNKRTQAMVMKHFYWPKPNQAVLVLCCFCPICELVGKPNQKVYVAPLTSVPVMEEFFPKVLTDCIGTCKN